MFESGGPVTVRLPAVCPRCKRQPDIALIHVE